MLKKNLFFGVNKGLTWKQGFKRPVEAPKTQHSAKILRQKFHCVDQPVFQKKHFLGEKEHDPEQSKGLEARIKTPRGTPKNTIQCKNPPTGIPNFERRAAAAAARLRSAFAPATLLEHWLQVGSRFAASRSRSHYYRRIVSFPQQHIR